MTILISHIFKTLSNAPYLQYKSANRVLDMVLFLMFWSLNSSKIAPLEGTISAYILKILMLN